jgi:cytochrome b561
VTRKASYTRTAIVLHWLIAIGVFAQLSLGLWMIGIPKSPPGLRAYWFNVHKSIGITLGVLILVRVLWRLAHRAPPLPTTLPAWQRIAARANHMALYGCMVIMPLAGFLGSSFTGYPIKYFGHTLPHWGWESQVLKEFCSIVHLTTAIVLMVLIAIHVAAALKHLLARREPVFQRMWAWPPRERPEAYAEATAEPLTH